MLALAFNLLALKIAYRTSILHGAFWGALMFVFITGVILLLWARQHTFRHDFITGLLFLLGLEGEVLLFGVVFLLLNAESLLLRPEMWPFLDGRPFLFGSWQGLIRFAEFVLLALLLAVSARLATSAESDRAQAHPATLAAVLLLPLCLLLELALVPALARSMALLVAGGLFLVTVAAAGGLLTASCFGSRKVGRPLLGTVCLLIAFWVLGGFAARETILVPVALAGLETPGEVAPGEKLEQLFAEKEPAAPTPDVSEGESLFNQQCTVCHRFDQRLVGPPLNEVVPKYRENKAQLQAFLQNPVKIDPEYPAMPDLNLTDQESSALAEFLLSRNEGGEQNQSSDKP